MVMKKLIIITALLLVPSGCGAVLRALPTVIQYVQDAQMILDMLDRQARPRLAQADEDIRKSYDRSYTTAQQTLQVALRSSKGVDELSKEQIDEAFKNFREAYKDLLAVLSSAGLMQADGTMKAAPGAAPIDVPEPMAITIKKP